jgi:patatin-like phospholipase/acyl hydrolase
MNEKIQPTFHVLALSGGGYRGLYTATVLAEMERVLGKPIAKHFDLICGTSVGGLLALGLADEIPMSELVEVFTKHGETIFKKKSWWHRRLDGWCTAKYDSQGLHSVLSELFGDKTIGDLKHPILIPTVNYSTGKGQFFKTPHHPSFKLDYEKKVVDVAMATTAAPTYFPLFKSDSSTYVDGGLVGNAPGLFGLHEVNTFLSPDEDAVTRLLAIGTMTIGATSRGNINLNIGILGWGAKLFDLIISAQESSTDHMLKHMLKDNYFSIDDQATPDQSKDINELDKVSKAATDVLIARGKAAARRAIGDRRFDLFSEHIAKDPTFYFGPNIRITEMK